MIGTESQAVASYPPSNVERAAGGAPSMPRPSAAKA
jgi:hypothetical protein